MTQKEPNEQLLFFNPEIVFAETPGGIKPLVCVDAFNDHIG